MTHRLTTWADARLLPALVVILLLVDLGVGVNWTASSDMALSSPAYAPAKRLMPMHAYGTLFLCAAVCAATLLCAAWRTWWAGYSILIAGSLWVFWAVLYSTAALMPNVSWQAPVTSSGLAALHMLAGLAASRSPDRTV